ncbi:cytokine receptor family member B15 [Triplophysa dalaica]|uniref:cytokine receptor family member B15 n=1 Tax=Triplophysa dalaica TaxID=1582913 RepID=UPI0024DF8A9C|nr:cytokine receptor family member B15 [Triplophysa dalaica]
MFMELRMLPFIFFMTLHVHSTHAGKLAAPEHVKITSVNMGAVVEYLHNSMDNVTYTTRYSLGKVTTYICNNSKELKCDAGQLPTVFGRYVFQVRAELQGRFSKWVNADPFTPDTQTIIGPPAVHLFIKRNILEVHVQDPVLKVGRLRNIYSEVSYVIKYWIDGYEESVIEKKINNEDEEEDVKMRIKELSSWSRYCTQVRMLLKDKRNQTPFSPAVCVHNVPVLTSCVIAVAVLLPLVLLSSWLIYKVKEFLYPETELPDRFSKFEAIQHPSNQKEKLDKISAISEDHFYEVPTVKAKNPEEDTCCLAPFQEVEYDYKHLMQTKPEPTFYPNHLYPICLKNKFVAHLNQTGFGSSIQSCYYNLADSNFNMTHTNIC